MKISRTLFQKMF